MDKHMTKEEQLQEMFRGRPDAIFVLSGGIIPKGKASEEYKSTAYGNCDHRGLLGGGKARVIAAAEAAAAFPESAVITTSYLPSDPEAAPTHASVMAAELERYGVPKEQIVLEEGSTNTLTELAEMAKLAAAKDWQRVAILTNDYHIPRTQGLLNRLQELSSDSKVSEALKVCHEKGVTFDFVSAETILPLRSTHYRRLFEEVKKTSAYQKRVVAEERGLRQLREGTYDTT